MQSSNVEESQDKHSDSTVEEEEAPQVADKEEEATVEESHKTVQDESVKMEQDEEEVEVDVDIDVETRDDEATKEVWF